MKTTQKNITLITRLVILSIAMFVIGPKLVGATWNYYGHSIPYIVTQTPPQAISVSISATPASMTLPTNQTVITWTTSTTPVPDSCTGSSGSSGWIGSKNASGGSQTMTGLAVGTYTYTITCVKPGLPFSTVSDSVTVVVSPLNVGPSGLLTISPNHCFIAIGGSTCTVTGATWTTTNVTSPSVIDANVNTTISTLSNNSVPMQVWVAYPSTVFNLKDGATLLDTKSASASCISGSSWNGSSCVASVINGICSEVHWYCSSGTSTNNATGSNSWTWNCVGSNGGGTSSCSESFGPGGGGGGGGGGTLKHQCSDGIDNDDPEDTLIDEQDPGCHSDKDPNNHASYLPLKDSERDGIKPTYIEL